MVPSPSWSPSNIFNIQLRHQSLWEAFSDPLAELAPPSCTHSLPQGSPLTLPASRWLSSMWLRAQAPSTLLQGLRVPCSQLAEGESGEEIFRLCPCRRGPSMSSPRRNVDMRSVPLPSGWNAERHSGSCGRDEHLRKGKRQDGKPGPQHGGAVSGAPDSNTRHLPEKEIHFCLVEAPDV